MFELVSGCACERQDQVVEGCGTPLAEQQVCAPAGHWLASDEGRTSRCYSALLSPLAAPAYPVPSCQVAVDLLQLEDHMFDVCRHLPSVRQAPAASWLQNLATKLASKPEWAGLGALTLHASSRCHRRGLARATPSTPRSSSSNPPHLPPPALQAEPRALPVLRAAHGALRAAHLAGGLLGSAHSGGGQGPGGASGRVRAEDGGGRPRLCARLLRGAGRVSAPLPASRACRQSALLALRACRRRRWQAGSPLVPGSWAPRRLPGRG